MSVSLKGMLLPMIAATVSLAPQAFSINEEIKLDEKAIFVEGVDVNSAPYYSILEMTKSVKEEASDLATIAVTPDGSQYLKKVSKKEYKIFKKAIEKLENIGFSSALFNSAGFIPSGVSNEQQEVVIGTDQRTQVNNTVASPYWFSGRIDVGCSGTLVGPKHVLTAGHCVSPGNGTWYSNLNFTVAQNGSYKPWGSESWARVITTNAWFNNGESAADYAMIILHEAPHGGWSGYGVYGNNGVYQVAGYPGDKPFGTMWTMSGQTTSTSTHIQYQLDTAGGQSGSGIRDTSGYVRGVHTLGSLSGNSGTRMTSAIFNKVKGWIADNP